MNFTPIEFVVVGASIMGVLMVGSGHIRVNLFYYSLQTLLIAVATAIAGYMRGESSLYVVAGAIALFKAFGVPAFLNRIIDRIKVASETGMLVPAPLAMHFSIALMGIAYLCTQELPVPPDGSRGWPGATAAISLVFTGLILMLTRRVALSEIVGFLVIENGIYTFALIQTRHMPMIIEMGILLDVLVGVMIFGLLVNSIQRSFEHIDVAQLTELKD
jgi:hydrogenase-4 membrane subunit HyfE